jgi:protein transport protein SEC24
MPPEVSFFVQYILTNTYVTIKAGTIGEHGVSLPPALPLTSERLERHGLFLIEDGQTIFLWVGRDAVPQLIQDVFDLPSYDVLRGGKVCLGIVSYL